MRHIATAACLALLALAGLTGAPQSKKAAPKASAAAPASFGNAEAISEEELKIYLYFLASDQLEGRNLPSRGYDTAALYIASHLAEWAIAPGGSTTGTNGPLQRYFMPIELASRQVIPAESKLTVTGGGRGAAGFEYGKDWSVTAGGRGAPPVQPLDLTGSLVFAGNGYVIHK